MMNAEIGFGRKVLQVLEEQGISFEHIPSGIDTMTVFIHQDEFAEKEQQVIASVHRTVNPDYMELESDLALIAVVGRGMRSNRGTCLLYTSSIMLPELSQRRNNYDNQKI